MLFVDSHSSQPGVGCQWEGLRAQFRCFRRRLAKGGQTIGAHCAAANAKVNYARKKTTPARSRSRVAVMKCQIPEISWHNRDPVLSVDIQPKGANDRDHQ